MTAATTARIDPTRPDGGADAWETPHGFARILAPTPKGRYYRISAGKGVNRKQSTAPSFEAAWRKALIWETEILDGATPASERLLDEGIDYWLPSAGWPRRSRNQSVWSRGWSLPGSGTRSVRSPAASPTGSPPRATRATLP